MRFIGLFIAILFSIFIFLLAGWNFFEYRNEIVGKAAAEYWGGVGTILAFVWLIAGYAIQWRELSLQREQMALSTKELKTQSDALSAQVSVSRAQSDAISLQAKITRQSALISIQKEFSATISSFIFDQISGVALSVHSKKSAEGSEDQYGVSRLLVPFARADYLWEIFSKGRSDIILIKSSEIFHQAGWLMEREISTPISSEAFQKICVDIFDRILNTCFKYENVIKDLNAEIYDQRPFDGIASSCWWALQHSKVLDDHFLRSQSMEPREIVSGPEWIKRSGYQHVEPALRYLFEGNINLFEAISSAIPDEYWIRESARRIRSVSSQGGKNNLHESEF